MSAVALEGPVTTETAVAELERVLRVGSKTFHFASRALPRRMRAPTLALYAFCRKVDDDVDEPDTPGGAEGGLERVLARIDRIYAGRGLDDVVERAFSEVVASYAFPRVLVDALAEGMAWDVAGRRYQTVDGVRAYGARVAGTVGVMMTLLMGRREPEVLARACDLGVAMQLTNIARDVGEDARRGRLYLPTDWLEAEGVDAEAFLASPSALDGVRAVTGKLLDHAEGLYARADRGIPHLPADCRIAIRAARLVYSDIGRVVRARQLDSVSSRAVVSLPRKLWLLGCAVGARFWSPAQLEGRPSREAAALLATLPASRPELAAS